MLWVTEEGVQKLLLVHDIVHLISFHQVSASSLQPHDGLEEMANQPLGTITEKETPAQEANVESVMADI